jgi:hypothetical protein
VHASRSFLYAEAHGNLGHEIHIGAPRESLK